MTILALNLHCALFEMKCTLYNVITSLTYRVAVSCVFLGKTEQSRRGKIQKLINQQGRIRASRGGKMLKNNKRAHSFIWYLRVYWLFYLKEIESWLNWGARAHYNSTFIFNSLLNMHFWLDEFNFRTIYKKLDLT